MSNELYQMTIAVFNEPTGWVLPEIYTQRIHEAGLSLNTNVVVAANRQDTIKILTETDYLVGFPITEEEFTQHGSKLKWIQLTTAMTDILRLMPTVMSSPVRITTSAAVQAPQRAEHAIMLLLALLRQLHQTYACQLEHKSATGDLSSRIQDLSGKTVGVLGLGTVGRAIVHRLRAFDVKILATYANPEDTFHEADEIIPANPQAISDMVSKCDVLIVASTPLLVDDRLVDENLLKHVKPETILINVGRSRACDDRAVINALEKGKLAAAGLDTFDSSPLSESSPFWNMPNVIITPGLSGVSPNYWKRATDVVCDNLQRLIENRPLLDELPHIT